MSSVDSASEIQLFVWPADFGLASVDFECLQAMVRFFIYENNVISLFQVAAKISAAPVRFISTTNYSKSPTGSLTLYFINNCGF